MTDFKYIDIHCHPNLSEFDTDREEVITRMAESSVAGIVVGVDVATSQLATALAEKYSHLWAIIGQHPNDTDEDFDTAVFRELAKHPRVVAIGECGYDFFRTEKTWSNVALQEKNFRAHIELALEFDKPLMLHIRPSAGSMDAYEAALTTLREYKEDAGDRLRGDVHFFAGTLDIAKQFLELGFYISFTGVITFTHDYDEVLKYIPEDRVLLETDAPYVSPVPYRGTRCEPQYVIATYEKAAEIRGVDIEAFRKQVIENARRLFGLVS